MVYIPPRTPPTKAGMCFCFNLFQKTKATPGPRPSMLTPPATYWGSTKS